MRIEILAPLISSIRIGPLCLHICTRTKIRSDMPGAFNSTKIAALFCSFESFKSRSWADLAGANDDRKFELEPTALTKHQAGRYIKCQASGGFCPKNRSWDAMKLASWWRLQLECRGTYKQRFCPKIPDSYLHTL